MTEKYLFKLDLKPTWSNKSFVSSFEVAYSHILGESGIPVDERQYTANMAACIILCTVQRRQCTSCEKAVCLRTSRFLLRREIDRSAGTLSSDGVHGTQSQLIAAETHPQFQQGARSRSRLLQVPKFQRHAPAARHPMIGRVPHLGAVGPVHVENGFRWAGRLP